MRRAVSMVEQFPHNSPVTASDVREEVLLEFPYTLFYRVTSDEVIILAVAHQRQRPLYWRRRLADPDAG